MEKLKEKQIIKNSPVLNDLEIERLKKALIDSDLLIESKSSVNAVIKDVKQPVVTSISHPKNSLLDKKYGYSITF